MSNIIPAVPNNIQNGQVEDATPVMGNFNAIVSSINTNSVSTNNPNTIVARDGSGNFIAGTVTSTAVSTSSITDSGTLGVNGLSSLNGGANIGLVSPLPTSVGSMLFSYEAPINRCYIGDGTGYSFSFSKRAGSATSSLWSLNDSGIVKQSCLVSPGLTTATSAYSINDVNGTSANRISFSANSSGTFIIVGGSTSNPNIYIKNNDGSQEMGQFKALGIPLLLTDSSGHQWYCGPNPSNNFFYIETLAGAGAYLNPSSGVWTSTSDERLKDIIAPITGAYAGLDSLRTIIGKYKSDENQDSRFPFLIAQDVQKVLPEAVTEVDGTLNLAYSSVIPWLICAMKEQKVEFEALKAEFAAYKLAHGG